MEQRTKKPVFKVGIPHHRFYSPIASEKTKSKPGPCHEKGARKAKLQPSPPKRITRATQKRLEAKKAAMASASKAAAETATTRAPSPAKRVSSTKKIGKSFAPQNYAFKAPESIEEIPMFGRYVRRASVAARDSLAEAIADELPKPAAEIAPNFLRPSPQQPPKTFLNRQEAFDSLELPVNPDEVLSSTRVFPEQGNVAKKVDDSDPESKVIELIRDVNIEEDKIETPPRSGSPTPAMFSPYITTLRGKDSARRERRSKMGMERTTPETIPTKETIMQSLNISVEEEERTAQYFKFLLQREINRLNEMCSKWEKIKSEPDVNEDGLYLINQAVGQTNLLVRKKFERFRGLVLDCESGKGEMLVQCRDLQGFWDMMYMEVKNCEFRFEKLETLRSKNWIEEEIVTVAKKIPAGIRKKAGATKFTGNAKSSIRSFILAKKKNMAQAEQPLESGTSIAGGSSTSRPSTSRTTAETPADKVPSRHSIKKTANRTPLSLRKQVQLSQSKKSIHSPLAIIKVSQMGKTPEVRLDDTISYVNSDQTPQKSILKKSTADDTISASDSTITKSTRKVDFNDEVVANEAEDIDENLENSIDLGRALARIDSYASDESSDELPESLVMPSKNVTIRRIEKRLDFENESFNESKNLEIGAASTSEIPIVVAPESPTPPPLSLPVIRVTDATPVQNTSKGKYSRSKRHTGTTVAQSPILEKAPEEEASVTRVLRNRTISTNTPNQRNQRRSTKTLDSSKLHDLDSSTKENNNPAIIDLTIDTDDQLTKRRRSTRRSVRFNGISFLFSFYYDISF